MAQYYRVVIQAPATKTQLAKTWVFSPDSENVIGIDVDLRKEGRMISTATMRIQDPRVSGQWHPIFTSMPDPAFVDIPFQVYVSKPSEGQTSSKLVFDGKLTSLQPAYPAPSQLTFVAHDRSIDARLQASYDTFKNKRSSDIAQIIAQRYGWTVDASDLVGIVLTQRLTWMAMGGVGTGALSDWHHLTRALAVDGLELYVGTNKTLKIRKSSSLVYPHTFRPDDDQIISFEPTINHVGGPGMAGQSKMPVPGGNKGTALSTTGTNKGETDSANADATTHRSHPQGPASNANGSHTESTGNDSGPAFQRRKRKDEAVLVTRALPDLGLKHILPFAGWGGKIDGNWHIAGIRFAVPGAGDALSHINLTREPSGASDKQIGIQPAGTSSH